MPDKPSKLMPALYGGIIMGVISGVPFLNIVNCLCCAGLLLGGFMAVFFYKKDLTAAMPPLTSGDGVQLGALAGLIGAIVANLLDAILLTTVGNISGEMIYDFISSLDFFKEMPPDAMEQMEEGLRETGIKAFNVILSLILYPIFGLLGGLIGYSVFKPKSGVVPPPPPVQAQA